MCQEVGGGFLPLEVLAPSRAGSFVLWACHLLFRAPIIGCHCERGVGCGETLALVSKEFLLYPEHKGGMAFFPAEVPTWIS